MAEKSEEFAAKTREKRWPLLTWWAKTEAGRSFAAQRERVEWLRPPRRGERPALHPPEALEEYEGMKDPRGR